MKSFPFHEPGTITILVYSSFIVLLNAINHVLDKFLYCGLIGQIFLGIAWGSPGGGWLSPDTERVVVNLGYLGLILLVYQGGVETEFGPLLKNLWLSASIAMTGVLLPVAMSFVLMPLAGATAVESFASGAALCATSVGATLAILDSTNLRSSRMGVTLVSAAIIDDVIGLVMMQVISGLGDGDFTVITVIQPVFVAIAFAVVPILACMVLNYFKLTLVIKNKYVAIVFQILTLFGLCSGASYAGTSILFAAYVAGTLVTYLDKGEFEAMQIFEEYLAPPLNRLLRPFLFAAFGFAVPIRDMFKGPIVWRGMIYALLMVLGKLACGGWLVRLQPGEKHKNPIIYPGMILGTAMVCRGEVGFLISTMAQSKEVVRDDIFMIATWAILLSTVFAPFIVGLIVKHANRVENRGGTPFYGWK